MSFPFTVDRRTKRIAFAIVGVSIVAVGAYVVAVSTPKEFKCYKSFPDSSSASECAPNLPDCDTQGCFAQAIAYCFLAKAPALFTRPSGGSVVFSICGPTLEACQQWHRDRSKPENWTMGSCAVTHVAEYVGLEEPTSKPSE